MDVLACRLLVRSINISKQLIMIATFLPKDSRKHSSIVYCKLSRSGQIIKSCSLMSICASHFKNSHDTLAADTLKKVPEMVQDNLIATSSNYRWICWNKESLPVPSIGMVATTWLNNVFKILKFGKPVKSKTFLSLESASSLPNDVTSVWFAMTACQLYNSI